MFILVPSLLYLATVLYASTNHLVFYVATFSN